MNDTCRLCHKTLEADFKGQLRWKPHARILTGGPIDGLSDWGYLKDQHGITAVLNVQNGQTDAHIGIDGYLCEEPFPNDDTPPSNESWMRMLTFARDVLTCTSHDKLYIRCEGEKHSPLVTYAVLRYVFCFMPNVALTRCNGMASATFSDLCSKHQDIIASAERAIFALHARTGVAHKDSSGMLFPWLARLLSVPNVSNATEKDLMNKLEDVMAELAVACPCRWVAPCSPRCTCVVPESSYGCRRCCTYGSSEQKVASAELLAALVPPDAHQHEHKEKVRAVTDHPIDDSKLAVEAFRAGFELAQKEETAGLGFERGDALRWKASSDEWEAEVIRLRAQVEECDGWEAEVIRLRAEAELTSKRP